MFEYEGYAVDVSVVIEPVTGIGYRAIGAGGISVGLTAESATADEAIDRLAALVQHRLNSGARLAQLSVGTESAPWKQDGKYLRDSPLYQTWREAIEGYRRQLDDDSEAL